MKQHENLDIFCEIIHTKIMRNSARICYLARLFTSVIIFFGIGAIFLTALATPSLAQTPSPSVSPVQQATQTVKDFQTVNTDPDVPLNQHTYTQIVVINVLSAMICQLVGIDPIAPKQPCLGINPLSNKIGLVTDPSANQFGYTKSDTPKLGGALGTMNGMIGMLYTPTVSSSEYTQYLANNFGIVKPALATGTTLEDCSKSVIGYGACGLKPIFNLWSISRDISYAFLVLVFVFLGLGIMTRFKVDARTVMSLQNQIPGAVIGIFLITFSYAIAGFMIDMMWTATYTGINLISQGQTAAVDCSAADPNQQNGTLAAVANANLINQPISFVNAIFDKDCDTADAGSGIINLSNRVSDSLGALITNIISNIFGWDQKVDCTIVTFSMTDCLQNIFVSITELIVSLIIIIAIFIALFRLWFQLIKSYISLLIFIILGPIWIIMGLVPGKPMGFERWLRLIFAGLAGFPLVAYVLVFGDVMVNSIPVGVNPNSLFIPPLVGNPNVAAFSTLIGFGAIMIAPNIPGEVRDRMKVPAGKLGAAAAGGVAVAAGVATAPATRAWKQLNRKNNTTGAPEGALAVFRHKALGKLPGVNSSRIRQLNRRLDYRAETEGSETDRRAAEARRASRRGPGRGSGSGPGR